jgi:hypothetical protein
MIERRNDARRCKCCGSSDLWRVDERSGIVAAVMRYRGRKPFQCRACGWVCYRIARRSRDTALPLLARDGPFESGDSLLKLSGAVAGTTKSRGEREETGAEGNSTEAAALKD